MNGFADVLGRDLRFSVEIGDRARDLQDSIIGASAKVQFAHGHANQFLGVLAQLAVLLQLARRHAGIAIYFRLISKTFLLAFPGSNDALANGGRRFLSAFARDVAIFARQALQCADRCDRAAGRRCADGNVAPEAGRSGIRVLDRRSNRKDKDSLRPQA